MRSDIQAQGSRRKVPRKADSVAARVSNGDTLPFHKCNWRRSLNCGVQVARFRPDPRRRGLKTARRKEDDVLSTQPDATMIASTGPAIMAPQNVPSSETLLERILTSLNDNKAEDIVQIDLRGKTSIGDYMVIATGRSSRQVAAICENLVERLKQDFGRVARVEGKETGDWVLIDTGDVIVHVFRPEVREFYQLEKMWLPMAATAN